MAIIHSCCFWRSLRNGSYASAIYTLIYFGISCLIVSIYLYEERKYLSGETDKPSGESFLEKDAVSSATVIFNVLLLICALCGVLSSFLVILGLKTNKRELLLPWIATMIGDILVECVHFIYLIILETLDFEPLTATLFTIDFFIMCLNVYCLLCVISQYQEFKAGRGGVDQTSPFGTTMKSLHYVPPPATINQSHHNNVHQKKTLTNQLLCPHTNCTIIPEEQVNGYLGTTKKSPCCCKNTNLNNNNNNKKHVQFPDESKYCADTSFVEEHNGNGPTIVIQKYNEKIVSWNNKK